MGTIPRLAMLEEFMSAINRQFVPVEGWQVARDRLAHLS